MFTAITMPKDKKDKDKEEEKKGGTKSKKGSSPGKKSKKEEGKKGKNKKDKEAKAEEEEAKQKMAKDPAAPKKPSTTFFLFSNDNRAKVKEEHPAWKPKEVISELGRMWREETSEDEKKKYDKLREKKLKQ